MLATKGADVNWKSKDSTPLIMAILTADPAVVRSLIAAHAHVNLRDPRGKSPLQAVIVERMRKDPSDERRRADDREVLRLLVDAGADIRVRGKYGDTPLHLAAARDREDLAALLIERGAEIDALDDSTWTPLHMAADRRSIAVAKVLLDHGAFVNARNSKEPRTPLNLVWGDPELKALLERYGGREASAMR